MSKKNILVIVESDCKPEQTIDRALYIAGLLERKLDILFCETSYSALPGGIAVSSEAETIRQHILEWQENIAEELAEPVRNAGKLASVEVLLDRPIADGILAKALDTEPCLVVKGTQFHSSAERSILVDTDWQLLRKCPYQLWLVKHHEFHDEPRIAAAVDPTHAHDKPAALDQIIVEAAQMVAKLVGGEVELIHTYMRLSAVSKAATKAMRPIKLPIDEIDQRIKTEHREALDRLAAGNGIDSDHVHQLPGRTHDILPSFVRANGIDLVVMGALARWGIKRMIIGSTAERVLDHLPCDVLIVRDNGTCDEIGGIG